MARPDRWALAQLQTTVLAGLGSVPDASGGGAQNGGAPTLNTQTQVQGGVSVDNQSSNTVNTVFKPPGS